MGVPRLMIGVPGETEHRNQHQRAPCKVRTGGNEPEGRSVLPFWELMDIGSRCTRGCVNDRSAAFSRGGQWDMDLRPYLPSTDRVERAAGVLNYQPFMLSDDVQTGVAYSFVNGGDPRVSPPLLFRRRDFEDRWDAITDANARLRAMPAAAADIERKTFGEMRIVRPKIQPVPLHGAAITTRDPPHFEFQNNPKYF